MRHITPVAIAVIYNPTDKKLLLTKRKEIDFEDRAYGHCWNFPGGGILFGEDPIQAVHREIWEELKVKVHVQRLLPRIFSSVRNSWHGLLICYLCTLVDQDKQIVLDHESLEYGWFSISQIKNLQLLPLGYEIALEAMALM